MYLRGCGTLINKLPPQPLRSYFEILINIAVRIIKQGMRDGFSVCKLRPSEKRPGL